LAEAVAGGEAKLAEKGFDLLLGLHDGHERPAQPDLPLRIDCYTID
jgi:hypothetical protein